MRCIEASLARPLSSKGVRVTSSALRFVKGASDAPFTAVWRMESSRRFLRLAI